MHRVKAYLSGLKGGLKLSH